MLRDDASVCERHDTRRMAPPRDTFAGSAASECDSGNAAGTRNAATNGSELMRSIRRPIVVMTRITIRFSVFLFSRPNAAVEPRAKAHRFCESGAQRARTPTACYVATTPCDSRCCLRPHERDASGCYSKLRLRLRRRTEARDEWHGAAMLQPVKLLERARLKMRRLRCARLQMALPACGHDACSTVTKQ